MPKVVEFPVSQTLRASFPVFRSGLVIDSPLRLSAKDALDGLKILSEEKPEFTDAMLRVLKRKGANILDVDGSRSPRISTKDDPRRFSLMFEDILFRIGGDVFEARTGLTICDGERQSKIAVRVVAIELNHKVARDLTTDKVASFFDQAQELTDEITEPVLETYQKSLTRFASKGLDSLAPSTELTFTKKCAFTMRAYDSADDRTFDLIQELDGGMRLSEALQFPHYRSVFQNLWSVARENGKPYKIDPPTFADELRRSENFRISTIGRPFVDRYRRDRVEQRALVVSTETHRNGLPTTDYTSVSCEPLFDVEYSGVNRKSAAFRMSGHLFAKHARQF